MTSPPQQSAQPAGPARYYAGAALSLVAGLLVYATARPSAPSLLAELWHTVAINPVSTALSIPFAYQLPSFFHMLAMLLATLAVTHGHQKIRLPALGVTLLLGVLMEFVQHPAVLDQVADCAASMLCRWLPGLVPYARRGTYDPLDLLAIALAAFAILLILYQPNWLAVITRTQKEPAK